MSVLTRNNVKTYGSGTAPIMFAHGYGCDQNVWGLVAPAFADSHKVVVFDLVGAGGSDWAAYDFAKYADLSGYAADVIEVAEALALQDVVFVGHSVSASIGLLAAIRRIDGLKIKGVGACSRKSVGFPASHHHAALQFGHRERLQRAGRR